MSRYKSTHSEPYIYDFFFSFSAIIFNSIALMSDHFNPTKKMHSMHLYVLVHTVVYVSQWAAPPFALTEI